MSNFPDAHKVYDLAALFRERVIEEGRSFLWPDQEIWRVENAKAAYEWYLQNLSPKTFSVDTVGSKGREHSVTTTMLAADCYALCILTPIYTTQVVKTRLTEYFDQADVPVPDPETLNALLENHRAQVPLSIFHYSGDWPQRITSVLGLVMSLISETVPSDASYVQIKDAIVAHLGPNGGRDPFGMTEAIALLYPEVYPVTAGRYATQRVIKRYHTLLGDPEGTADDVDLRTARDNDRLTRIYQILAPGKSFKESAFYDPGIIDEWEINEHNKRRLRNGELDRPFPSTPIDGTAGISHHTRTRLQVYEIAQRFREQAMRHHKSLLWPNESVWTDEAIEEFLTGFKEMPVEKGKSWLQVYENQFANRSPVAARILADSYAFIMQFPSLDVVGAATKTNTLRTITGWAPETQPEGTALDTVIKRFGFGVGSPGRYFSNNVQYQLAFVPSFVRQFRTAPEKGLLSAVDAAVLEVKQDYLFKKSVTPARNIVLHLLEPNSYERIASNSDKVRITERFIEQLDLDFAIDDIDAQIREIRSSLENRYFRPGFDFYDEEIKPYWLGNQVLNSTMIGKSPISIPSPPIADLADATHLDESFLRGIENLLEDKKQLIFEGPPGSGKTYVAEKFARYFTGQPLTDPEPDASGNPPQRNEQVELIQFHQSYSYEDFVEGIRPDTNTDGQLVYETRDGIFLELARKAAHDPLKKFVLIIDEINRGNVSRILGELMLLLEYRDKSARLPYSKDQFQIPPNLYIIGTMNSADRSLSQIDYALRRRFYFVSFMSVQNGRADVLDRWLASRIPDTVSRQHVVDLFVELNSRLSARLGTDDLQVGHSYFMHPHIHEPARQQQVWTYAIEPLLREYLYHDRDREKQMDLFSLEKIRTAISRTEPLPGVPGESGEA